MKHTQQGSVLLPTLILTTLMLFLLVSLWEILGMYQSVNQRAESIIGFNHHIDRALTTAEQWVLNIPVDHLPTAEKLPLSIQNKNSLQGTWWRQPESKALSFWQEKGNEINSDTSTMQHFAVIEHYAEQCDGFTQSHNEQCVQVYRITVRSLSQNGITFHTQTLFSRR